MTKAVVLSWSGGKDSSLALDALRADDRYEVPVARSCRGESSADHRRASAMAARVAQEHPTTAAVGEGPSGALSRARDGELRMQLAHWSADASPVLRETKAAHISQP